jgi:uncharacterized protein (DUF433 family)
VVRQVEVVTDADRPIYTLVEAARYAQTSPQSIARWRAGYSYPTLRGTKRSGPLTGGPGRGLLSFSELLEVAAVAAARQVEKLPMRSVRTAVDAARKLYGVDRPFLLLDLKTDGRELFIRQVAQGAGRESYVNLSRAGQTAWEHIEAVLRDLDYEHGRAARWWVAGRREPIVIDPSVSFGRPYVIKKGVSTDAVRSRIKGGDSLAFIGEDFGLTADEIAAVLRFELPTAA